MEPSIELKFPFYLNFQNIPSFARSKLGKLFYFGFKISIYSARGLHTNITGFVWWGSR